MKDLLKWIWGKMNENKEKTALIAYFFFFFLFAYTYLRIYECNQKSFVFAKDINETKIQERVLRSNEEKTKLEFIISALDSVHKKIIFNKQVPDSVYQEPFNPYSQGYRYKIDDTFIDFTVSEIQQVRKKDNAIHNIYVWNDSMYINRTVNYRIESFPYDSLSVISNIIDIDKENIKSEIELLEQEKIHADWRFIDFLYFSAMTQTTIGYGDILPNSSFVRFLVMIQALLGVICTVFFVMEYSKKRRNKQNASR